MKLLKKIQMRKILFIIILISIQQFIAAQSNTNFRSPLDIPLYLSGNFGELRSDHFHSGIDIKTQGVIGQKVYAIEDGYVSRIKVQGGGYGNALYIAHPNGYTSVYGHLSGFNSQIAEYTRNAQYENQTFEIDLYLKPGQLLVTQGDIIALSGNSGSSSGPHLHFEIRKSSNQHPANALLYNFPIKDDIPPVFNQLVIYPRGDDSQIQQGYKNVALNIEQEGRQFMLNDTAPIIVFGKIGFGVEVYDYLNGSRNRCGVYSLELKVDDQTRFSTEMGEFSFSESRFINAHIDYAHKQESKHSVQRLYKLPFNGLSIYRQVEEMGLIDIRDTLIHEVSVIATDVYANQSVLNFYIKGSGTVLNMASKPGKAETVFPYNASGGFEDRDIKISFPAFAFYEDVPFSYIRTSGLPGTLSDLFHVHNSNTPVHKAFKLSIKPNADITGYEDKLCIVAINGENEAGCVGGVFDNGYVTTDIRSFGNYSIALDTLAPSIAPLNLHPGKKFTTEPGMRFVVKDDLSGISNYTGYIDNKWILMEFDPKNDLLIYTFDNDRLSSGQNHEFELYVEDSKGNRSFYHTTFFR